jgi:hypothetical protein
MEPILISVLSVLATLLVILQIWMVRGIRKAQKNDITYAKQIIDLHNLHDDTQRKIDEVEESLSSNIDERAKIVEDLKSEIDRRFDKLYQKFYADSLGRVNNTTGEYQQLNS